MEHFKTEEQLEKMPTKRLLSYLKSVRGRKIGLVQGCTCECCGEASWSLYPNEEHEKEYKLKYEKYLALIKLVLNTREHVKR